MEFAKINVRVKNLDEAVDYARDVLGAEVVRERNTISFGQMALVRLGGLLIEIIAPDSDSSPLAQLIEKRGEGIDSIGFYVPELNEAAGAMEAKGARFSSNDGRLAWVHPKNPLSLSVELLERSVMGDV